MWWNRFLDSIDLTLPFDAFIQCDNLQTMGLLHNKEATFATGLRHVESTVTDLDRRYRQSVCEYSGQLPHR